MYTYYVCNIFYIQWMYTFYIFYISFASHCRHFSNQFNIQKASTLPLKKVIIGMSVNIPLYTWLNAEQARL